MKIRICKEQGAILVTTIVVCAVLGIALGLTMLWARDHNYYMKRSQAWNKAIPVLEAGIEEALAHLHDYPTNRGINGWKLQTNNVYAKTRWIRDDYFYTTIDTGEPPKIQSEGHVRVPLKSDQYLVRTVLVTTTNRPLISAVIAVKNGIDMKGSTITIDSFDSTDPNYSDVNHHYDATKRKDGGNVTSNDGITNAFNVGNADIFGKVATGVGGTVDIGPQGTVGSIPYHTKANLGTIESGWVTHDANVSFPAVDKAPTGGLTPSGGTTNGVTYQYILKGGVYDVANLTGGAYVAADSTLVVAAGKNNFSVGSSSQIKLAPGVTLTVYNKSSSAQFSDFAVDNPGTAQNFIYWGMPSNQSVGFNGGVQFTGVILAPNADLTLGGSGSFVNFQGAIMSKSLTLNGGMNIHYDESLRSFRYIGYIVTSWNEL